ncbi:trypsin-like serine peptidase [Arsenicicoccus dermatophilus]|uniref:trypsin-like serine peptidase n=1 Tax=Arsenicicoccus dermatophilus TaxID=1076331 RepID=UPI003916EBF4
MVVLSLSIVARVAAAVALAGVPVVAPAAGRTPAGARAAVPAAPAAGSRPVTAVAMPQARPPVGLRPAVAAVWVSPTASRHTCSAAVLDAPGGSLVVTAAHCTGGRGTNLRITPGYESGRRPYGTWAVVATYVDPAWQAGADPRRDLAVLRVAPQTIGGVRRTIASVVGGYRLGRAAPYATPIHGYGYRAGAGDRPVGCVNRESLAWGYPTLVCGGMTGGVSGGPLVVARPTGHHLVTGVIGGLHEGGCTDAVSYSSPFGAWSDALLARAVRGGPGDVVRRARGSGC